MIEKCFTRNSKLATMLWLSLTCAPLRNLFLKIVTERVTNPH